MTLRSFVHPDDAHGTAELSGIVGRPQRAGLAQEAEHVLAERLVGVEPPGRPRVAPRPVGHVRQVEAEVRHRSHHRQRWLGVVVLGAELEQRALALERPLQLGRVVGVAEATPGDEVGARCHDRRRVELEERQPVDDLEEVGRPLGVEQLGAHGDAPRRLLGEPPHGHRGVSSRPIDYPCGFGPHPAQKVRGTNPPRTRRARDGLAWVLSAEEP